MLGVMKYRGLSFRVFYGAFCFLGTIPGEDVLERVADGEVAGCMLMDVSWFMLSCFVSAWRLL